jgi:hydroxyacylglutathione hydrolase
LEEILNIHKIVTKPLDTNAYLIISEKTKKAIVVDPGFESFDRIMALVKNEEAEIHGIYLTHSHFDHIADVARFQRELDLKVFVHEEDAKNVEEPGSDGIFSAPDLEGAKVSGFLKDGEEVVFGDLSFRVIHTPGHSPGSVLFYFEEKKVLISGDTIFRGTYGRVDLPHSDPEKMKSSLAKIKELPEDVQIYPGHGGSTHIGREKRWL